LLSGCLPLCPENWDASPAGAGTDSRAWVTRIACFC
jgi:hypothetical protein